MIIKIFSDDEELLVQFDWHEDRGDDFNETNFWSAMRGARAQIEKEDNLIPEDDD